jgi:biotin carboxylase
MEWKIFNYRINLMRDYSQVRILVLGSNPETLEIVRKANLLGCTTFVINPVENSPAKSIAGVSYNADPRNSFEIDEIIRKETINAIILGVSDPLLPIYWEICERHNFPCYANKNSVKIFSSKSEFSKYCQLFGIKPIPYYDPEQILSVSKKTNVFPVVVKPIDSGAAVGISLCMNEIELEIGIKFALDNSVNKKIVVEKYMECDDLFAYFSVINGQVELATLSDRYKSTKTGKFNSVCLYANYPSKHLDSFLKEANSRFIKMIESLRIENAVLCIQMFYDGKDFYAYDPGFRIQGEGPHFYLNKIHNFDQIKMLLEFAIEGKVSENVIENRNDPHLKGLLARTIWILGSPGIVSEIFGLDELGKIPNVIKVLKRFLPGDHLTEEMIGTERQVLMRIYTIGTSLIELDKLARFISEIVRVNDIAGKSMISDIYSPIS